MIYDDIIKGKFISRPNRFIAHVEIFGKTEICHVKNTGRCKELLTPGAVVFVQKAKNPDRKTKFDLISVYKGERLINMDSQIPNKVFAQWVEENGFLGERILSIRPEYTYKSSRFDFLLHTENGKMLVEVKGVTLEENGVVMFPDAPTLRGVRHIEELSYAVQEDDYRACAVFVVQMSDVKYFTPNYATHPEFGEALKKAEQTGVRLLCLYCDVTDNSIAIVGEIPIVL